MKVLLAEDDPVARAVLHDALTAWGYEAVTACDGDEAWQLLQAPAAPKLAVLDWLMPGLDGLEICRRLRQQETAEPTYVLLVTARDTKDDVVEGLESGANDYITKPFHEKELRARLRIGRTVVELQSSLAGRIRQLEEALAQVSQLQGLLPLCCYCKRVRDDRNYWQQVEHYVAQHSHLQFSHAICPSCFQHVMQDDPAEG